MCEGNFYTLLIFGLCASSAWSGSLEVRTAGQPASATPRLVEDEEGSLNHDFKRDTFGPVRRLAASLNEDLEDIAMPSKDTRGIADEDDPEEALGGFEGDIILTDEQKAGIDAERRGRSKRNAVTDLALKWPNNELIYEISPHMWEQNQQIIKKVMGYIHDFTGGCIKFVPFSGNLTLHPNRVYFQNALLGCGSMIGRISSMEKQPLVLSFMCFSKIGTVMHEILHALGFWHEHSRSDRDDYIRVNKTAIKKGQEWNFIKNQPHAIDHLGTKYDYASVMHYKNTAFAQDYNYPTITQLYDTDKYTIGQRDNLSANDLIKIRTFYNCW